MTCEKCWADAWHPFGDQAERYSKLVKERTERGQICTPKEQAGDWWDEEKQCDKRTLKEDK